MLTLRLPLASGWGVLLSLATFWALWSMTSAPIEIDPRAIAKRIEFTRQIVDSKVTPEPRQPKPILEIQPTPPQPGTVGTPFRQTRPTFERYQRPSAINGGPVIEITTPGGGTNHDAQPIVRFEPDYPPSALRRGTEGWVQVQFSVSETGRVTDVIVVGANPRGVFEEESVKAVRRWLYSPRIEDGVAVERVGLQTVLRFEIPE
jgi:periplasmic protein TonB